MLADIGLLDGTPVTTHWAALDLLANLGNEIEVWATRPSWDSGRVVIATGVSAGIHIALHRIAWLHSSSGPARSAATSNDPDPPV